MADNPSQVLFMYPINFYISGVPGKRHPRSLVWDLVINDYSKALETTPTELERRANRLFNGSIENYRDLGFSVNWLFFSKKEDKKTPDTSDKSPIYDIRPQDRILPAGVDLEEFNTGRYPEPSFILDQLGYLKELVVGGFHYGDCVRRIVSAAMNRGINASADIRMTNKFFPMVANVFDQDLTKRMIEKGSLDPKMNRDNPEEMKRLIVGEELVKYL